MSYKARYRVFKVPSLKVESKEIPWDKVNPLVPIPVIQSDFLIEI